MEQNNKYVWKISEILGFEVLSASSGYLGVLYNVLPTGSNDIWVVRNGDREFLIPALKEVVREVNTADRKIFVSLSGDYESVFGKNHKSLPDNEKDVGIEFNGYIVYED
jgi:ribosomal 30S subunit maturation factor RimM